MTTKLAKKFRRELTANPKKGIALGILLVIAGYFWMPWIAGFLGKGSTQTSSAANTAVPTSASTPAKTTNDHAGDAPLTWQQLAACIDEDPLMRPADSAAHRDPFQAPPAVVDQKALAALVVPEPVVTPDAAGVVLSSTIVGQEQRLARVGRKTYRIGDHIPAAKDGLEIDFVLVAIEPRSVVLVRDGRRYELSLRKPHFNSSPAVPSISDDDLESQLGEVGDDGQASDDFDGDDADSADSQDAIGISVPVGN